MEKLRTNPTALTALEGLEGGPFVRKGPFKKALQASGAQLSDKDLDTLFAFFEGSEGLCDVNEVLSTLRDLPPPAPLARPSLGARKHASQVALGSSKHTQAEPPPRPPRTTLPHKNMATEMGSLLSGGPALPSASPARVASRKAQVGPQAQASKTLAAFSPQHAPKTLASACNKGAALLLLTKMRQKLTERGIRCANTRSTATHRQPHNRCRLTRSWCASRGIVAIARKFRIADDDNSKKLTREEFSKCLAEASFHIDPEVRK
jgi:hypothetical protein